MPPKQPVVSELFHRIRNGFTAELKFLKAYHQEAFTIARNEYKIPETHLKTLTRRALKAAIETVRQYAWQPNLLHRTVQSQATVLRWRQNRITDADYRDVKNTLERYLRNHLGKCLGTELNPNQEIVYGKTLAVFIQKVKSDNFILTSTLDTYLIGIARNLIKEFGHKQRPAPANTSFTTINSNKPPTDSQKQALLKKMRFYRTSHRLIARQFSLLDEKCLQIILQHYGIDAERVDAADEVPEPSEPMTEADFEKLFDVALGPDGKARKLKDIAPDVRISLKKISEKHLECVDKLVLRVIPDLLNGPDSSFADKVREEMKARLAEAQTRRQKKQLEKQRGHVNSRRP